MMRQPSLGRFELVLSKTVETNSYVSAIDCSDSTPQVCVVTPSGLHVLDSHSLVPKENFKSESKLGRITDVKFIDESTVMFCSSDGYLRLWDQREAGKISLEMASTAEPDTELKPLLSCDLNLEGNVACAGSEAQKEDAFVLFWDIRDTRTLLGGYWDSHSKDISQVKFHPSINSFLLTGGMDGLVNVFDIEEDCEDNALLYTLNAECAVNHVSWLNRTVSDVDRVAVVTTEEEFQLWLAEDAEPNLRKSREQLAQGISGDKAIVDHLVKAVTFDDGTSVVVGSSNEGKIELWSEAGVYIASMAGDHRDLVRAVAASRDRTGQKKALWSAGEDGILCYWEEKPLQPMCDPPTTSSDHLKARSSMKTKSKPYTKPYQR
ncbi:WD repeat-containing protein 89-like [Tropilaelaps mercedesae]|uniref:WD repeat-containing protein 89 n=1 Tax=Tropilaelaps mercedesae TaxID=418985 RepID=A0A1V9XAE6_9ACAR|nr:WD repeat-containing protein 89-like [Tropilaelaps mercedesae]